MRRILSGLLNLLIRWVDESISAVELQKRLLRAFTTALRRIQQEPLEFSTQSAFDLACAAHDLVKADLIADVPEALKAVSDASIPDLEQARAWRGQIPEGKVLVKSAFATGSGKMLDALDEAGNEEEKVFVNAALESLLRQVEVKRKKSLTLSLPEAKSSDLFIERQYVTLLFCHAASRRTDYRLLNAAFKLNDWSIKLMNPQRQTPVALCAQIRALAAAEASARRMLA